MNFLLEKHLSLKISTLCLTKKVKSELNCYGKNTMFWGIKNRQGKEYSIQGCFVTCIMLGKKYVIPKSNNMKLGKFILQEPTLYTRQEYISHKLLH